MIEHRTNLLFDRDGVEIPTGTFIHKIDANPPRFNFVQKPITQERAWELKLQRIRAAQAELEAAINAPLDETEGEYVKVENLSEDAQFEQLIVRHPDVFGPLRDRTLEGWQSHSHHDWLSEELKTKIQISP